jgi:hypothetical protein
MTVKEEECASFRVGIFLVEVVDAVCREFCQGIGAFIEWPGLGVGEVG